MNQQLATLLFFIITMVGISFASKGEVTINGVKRDSPKGCYNVNLPLPIEAENHSDETAIFYVGSRCSGDIIGEVSPGSTNHFKYGASVRIA